MNQDLPNLTPKVNLAILYKVIVNLRVETCLFCLDAAIVTALLALILFTVYSQRAAKPH